MTNRSRKNSKSKASKSRKPASKKPASAQQTLDESPVVSDQESTVAIEDSPLDSTAPAKKRASKAKTDPKAKTTKARTKTTKAKTAKANTPATSSEKPELENESLIEEVVAEATSSTTGTKSADIKSTGIKSNAPFGSTDPNSVEPFDATGIMEQLDFLIALHDESRPAFGEDDQLLGLWKQRFDLQKERLEEIAFSIESQKEDEHVDELFDTIHERFDEFEKRIVETESSNAAEPPQVDLSQITELLKQQNKRFDSIEKKIAEPNSPASIDPAHFDLSAVTELFAQQTKRFDAIENRIVEPQSSTTKQTEVDLSPLTELLDQQNTRFDAFETQLESLAEASTSPSSDSVATHAPDYILELVNERFDSVGSGLEKLTSILIGQQQLIEKQSQRIESLSNSDLASTDSATTETDPKSSANEIAEDNSATHWSRQKEAMLSKYGIDPTHRPSMELDSTLEEQEPETELMPELSESLDSLNPEDADAIQNLKEKLNAKLQAAEVEISIKRAKLSQFNAELDEKRVELDRRELDFQTKLSKVGPAKKPGMGIIERIKRHLTAKERKNLDRM